MLLPHQALLADRLIGSVNADGSWGYRPQTAGCAEPTALSCLALSTLDVGHSACTRGLAWLATLQRTDGGLPVSKGMAAPCWPTALAALAWQRAGNISDDRRAALPIGDGNLAAAVNWLLHNRGKPVPLDPTLFGHDTTLEGWAWVGGSHSWVEPTAYAILALRAVNKHAHPRVREGVRVLLDRALPTGGWNYGNTRVLNNTLRPFPATTGIVLAALAGEPRDARIEAAINYLRDSLPQVRSPLTLGWGVIGLTAWGAQPPDVQPWLARCAMRTNAGEPNALHDALLLLAAAGWRSEPQASARAMPGSP